MTRDDEDTPALFDHCVVIYSAMQETSEEHESGNLYTWEGFLTKLFQDVGYGVPRYTRITRTLSQMGCIEQVERGGGNKPSKWYLHKEPTIEDFEYAKGKLNTRERKNTPKARENQRIRDLTTTVLENRKRIESLEEINKALAPLPKKVEQLEQVVRTLIEGDSSGTHQRKRQST